MSDLVSVMAGGACSALLLGLAYLHATDRGLPRRLAWGAAALMAALALAVGAAAVLVALDAGG
jgi:hypothetical protein